MIMIRAHPFHSIYDDDDDGINFVQNPNQNVEMTCSKLFESL